MHDRKGLYAFKAFRIWMLKKSNMTSIVVLSSPTTHHVILTTVIGFRYPVFDLKDNKVTTKISNSFCRTRQVNHEQRVIKDALLICKTNNILQTHCISFKHQRI